MLMTVDISFVFFLRTPRPQAIATVYEATRYMSEQSKAALAFFGTKTFPLPSEELKGSCLRDPFFTKKITEAANEF